MKETLRTLLLLSLTLTWSGSASAAEVTDLYFAAKQKVTEDLVSLQETYGGYGKPFFSPEKLFTWWQILGVPVDKERGTISPFDDQTTDAVTLAIEVQHLKNIFRSAKIPEEVWRPKLILYEDVQLRNIENGSGLDVLPNLNRNNFESRYINGRKPLPGTQIPSGGWTIDEVGSNDDQWIEQNRAQHDILNAFAKSAERLTDAENAFLDLVNSIYKIAGYSNTPALWEIPCECGNGDFVATIEGDSNISSVSIISEFGYRVCTVKNGRAINNLSECSFEHRFRRLGDKERLYMAGDYRYQVVKTDNTRSEISKISFRYQEGYLPPGAKLIFSDKGHRIGG